MGNQRMRRWATTAVAGASIALAVGPACGDNVPPPEPLTLSGGMAALTSAVPAASVQNVAGVVHLLASSCPDLSTDRAATAATIIAAQAVGLKPDDDRWGRASRALTSGIAGHNPKAACSPQMTLWLGAGLVPVTVPTSAPATTTIALDVAATRLADQKAAKVGSAQYRRVHPGMTPTEIRKIFGSVGQTLSKMKVGRHEDVLIRWPSEGNIFAGIIVQFRDGRSLAKVRSVG